MASSTSCPRLPFPGRRVSSSAGRAATAFAAVRNERTRYVDSLAVSSRNAYLSEPERKSALALSRALDAARFAAPKGPVSAIAAARAVIDEAAGASPAVQLDYLTLVEPDTMAEPGLDYRGPAILLIAAKVGTTRLIDNAHLTLGGES